MNKLLVVLIILVQIAISLKAQIPFSTSQLPLIFIDTKGGEIIDDVKIDAEMGVIWKGDSIHSTNDAFNNYNGVIGIEIRGNSSANWPKKPYRIETRNADKSNNNVSLLGMPKENDWILLAPYRDKSLMRNALCFRIIKEMGWYAPRYKYCNLIVNNEYVGVYMLVESIKLDKNRVNIDKPEETSNPDSLTGGYLLEMTSIKRLNEGEPYILVGLSGQEIAVHSPKPENFTSNRREYITNYIYEIEARLKAKAYSGTNDYKDLINVESFVDHMLVSEVFRQLDAFHASYFFTKDINEKLTLGPAWDFNFSIGNYTRWDADNTNDFWLLNDRYSNASFWMKGIYADTIFMNLVKARYRDLRENILSTSHIFAIFDEYNTYIGDNRNHDYEKWPLDDRNKFVPEEHFTYEAEITFIKSWLKDRFSWLDEMWGVTAHPIINEIYTNEMDRNKQWIELYNPFEEAIDISGWKLVLNSEEYVYTIPPNTNITSEAYLVICTNKDLVSGLPEEAYVIENLNFHINSNGMHIQLQDSSSYVHDEITVDVSKGWPDISENSYYSLSLDPWLTDNSVGKNWNWSKTANGTPGEKNVIFNYEGLIITEVMSSNANSIADNNGEQDDWLELYNGSDHPINLLGLFLSDDDVITWKWEIQGTFADGETLLNPDQTTIIWADNDTLQGALHAGFKLDKEGSSLVLSRNNGFENIVIDEVIIPPLLEDQSYKRVGLNGKYWTISDNPDPNYAELIVGIDEPMVDNSIRVKLFPNPVHNNFNVDIKLDQKQELTITLIGIDGRVKSVILPKTILNPGHHTYNYQPGIQTPSGIYIVQIQGKAHNQNIKVVVL